MSKIAIARALGILGDVRLTMAKVNRGEDLPNHEPWINAFDEAIGLIKNEISFTEIPSLKRKGG